MDTNPETEVTGDAVAEAQLEALFSRGQKEEPEPQDDEPERKAAEEVGDDQPEATAEEELDDLEVDGLVLKVPKKAAEKLKAERMFQEDYTRKTQATAERNRVLDLQEKRLQLSAQAQNVLGGKNAEVQALQRQLEQYDQLNWSQLSAEQAYPLYAQRDQLRSQFEKSRGELQTAAAQFQQQTAATDAEFKTKLYELGVKRLGEELGGWTPEKQSDAASYLSDAGYQSHELDSLHSYDPRFIRMAYEAKQFRKLQATKADTIQKKTATAKPFVQTAARGIQKSQADSKAADLKARMAKTGRPDDVEAFLAARFSKRK